eukprot:Phypoly_transcript_15115.p1 GENE.Phypoly_transcript_15115~~Phypoly_transcript_15115.p1  ORF type:complete len:254 (+),score=22.47 Phypoly_transcript_15115:124-885(+)
MIKYIILALLFVGALSTTQTKTAADECSLGREAILLHNIKELDFLAGHFTASRRVAAIPQLECIGGSARGHHEPEKVRCVNIGNTEPHWRCEAALDDSVKLGHVIVTCEGYEGPLDPYVLRDSCGLKYSLEYTSWTNFILGYMYNAFTFFILTPIKWGIYLAAMGAVALVIVAAIRKPAHRQVSRSDKPIPSFIRVLFPKASDKEKEKEKKREKESSTRVGGYNLRDRKQIHSPYKDSDSPYDTPASTGLAAR